MSKRITLTLTDQEYADLEAQAQAERRTPREMAAYLVTRPQTVTSPFQVIPIRPQPFNPIWPGTTWCGTTDATGSSDGIFWNNPTTNLARGTQYPPLPVGTSGRHA